MQRPQTILQNICIDVYTFRVPGPVWLLSSWHGQPGEAYRALVCGDYRDGKVEVASVRGTCVTSLTPGPKALIRVAAS
jgi:hypothetical protein